MVNALYFLLLGCVLVVGGFFILQKVLARLDEISRPTVYSADFANTVPDYTCILLTDGRSGSYFGNRKTQQLGGWAKYPDQPVLRSRFVSAAQAAGHNDPAAQQGNKSKALHGDTDTTMPAQTPTTPRRIV
jgi:hypothetical protein